MTTEPTGGEEVTLREITETTFRSICALKVGENQKDLVAENAFSIAEASFSKHAWIRAIYSGELPVGFAMLYEDKAKPEFWLWRFMIAEEHQGKGYGKKALALLVARLATHPEAKTATLGVVPGDTSAQVFYERLGWKDSGRVEDGETIMEIQL
jgi:diamine N-acetyltransferase